MNNRILMVLVLTSLFTTAANAQNYQSAVGLRLSNGAPVLQTGLSMKHFFSEKSAVEGLINLSEPFGFGLLYEIHQQLPVEGLRMFGGGGGQLAFRKNTTYAGFSGIAGLDYCFKEVPINISLDWKPELNINPKTRFEAAAFGFTLRYAFR